MPGTALLVSPEPQLLTVGEEYLPQGLWRGSEITMGTVPGLAEWTPRCWTHVHSPPLLSASVSPSPGLLKGQAAGTSAGNCKQSPYTLIPGMLALMGALLCQGYLHPCPRPVLPRPLLMHLLLPLILPWGMGPPSWCLGQMLVIYPSLGLSSEEFQWDGGRAEWARPTWAQHTYTDVGYLDEHEGGTCTRRPQNPILSTTRSCF